MADVLPKMKMYIFLTLILVLINVAVFISKQSINIGDLIVSIGTSFIPFAGIIALLVFPSGLPVEFIALASVIIGIFSGIVTYLLVEIVYSHFPTVDT